MLIDEFNPHNVYFAAVRFWWLILIGIIFGGLLGLGFTSSRAPLYEASASLLVSVDRTRASVRDDITIYQADDRIRALVLSDETLQNAVDRLNGKGAGGMYQTPADFRAALKISQGPASIRLYFYSSDPEAAAEGANAWVDASLDELQQAYVHAVRAAELQGVLYEAHCSLNLLSRDGVDKAVWVCQSGGSEVRAENLPEALLGEVQASKGILPIYSFTLGQVATAPEGPVLWNRSGLIIAGLVLGALVGSISAVLLDIRKDQLGQSQEIV